MDDLIFIRTFPRCPLTRELAELSTKFTNYFTDDTRDCYQSTVAFEDQGNLRSYKFVSICCYNENR